MEFKNINQLKKEIEKFKKKREEQGDIYIDDAFVDGGKIRTLIALKDREAKLQTLQKVCEEIEKIPANETYCFKCKLGFDEDSDECFRCDGKDIEHRKLDISREELLKKFQGKEK